MGLSENSVPLHPMVLLIIIPTINGYFIGGIPHFQTYPDGEMFLKVYPGSSEGFPSWPWSRRQPALIFGGKPSLNGVVS